LTWGVRQQVNIPTTAGDMGILSQHVPSITQLRPGIVEIISEGTTGDKWFGMLPVAIALFVVRLSWTIG
jgi:F0F1-type ATP synthase epsilon subunit